MFICSSETQVMSWSLISWHWLGLVPVLAKLWPIQMETNNHFYLLIWMLYISFFLHCSQSLCKYRHIVFLGSRSELVSRGEAVHSQFSHTAVTVAHNSGKESSENIVIASLIGNSFPQARHTNRHAVALHGGSKLLKFNVFVAVAALIKGAIHNLQVIEEDKPINSQGSHLT